MIATWMADVLRDAGLDVYEMPGWETRQSRGGFDPQGIVWHHTGTGTNWTDAAVANLLAFKGNATTPPPLSQLGLERSGRYVCVAAGRCNHNGYGKWGNDSFGIEAYNDGRGEPWPQAQLDAYDLGSAAICRHLGWDPATHILAHREADPTRKIDPTGIDMDAARTRVAAILRPPAPPPEDDDVKAKLIKRTDGSPEWWVCDGIVYRHVKDRTDAYNLAVAGLAELDPETGQPYKSAFYDGILDRAKQV